MALDVRYGTILSIILIVSSIPFVVELMDWSSSVGIPKEVIGFSDLVICCGIGMLVDWLIERYTDWYDRWGGGM